MKKFKFAFLVAIGISFFGLKVSAATPSLHLEYSVDESRSKLIAEVSISENPGIASFLINLSFNKGALTPTSISKGDIITGDIVANIMEPGTDLTTFDIVSAFWVSASDCGIDGTLCYIEFDIKDNNATSFGLSLEYDEDNVRNEKYEKVKLDVAGTDDQNINSEKVTSRKSIADSRAGGTFTDTVSESKEYENIRKKVFVDIDSYDWAREAIYSLAENNIVNGTSDSTFSPGDNIKRGDYILILMRILGIDETISENFVDVPQDAYYYHAIATAKAQNLASGVGDNKFMPEEYIQRQDMFTLAYRILKYRGIRLNESSIGKFETYDDKDIVSDYAKDSIKSFLSEGIIQGSGTMLFPKNNATRAETAVFIYKLINYLKV